MRLIRDRVQRGDQLEQIHNGGMLDVVSALLAFGADPSLKNCLGQTAPDLDPGLWARVVQQASMLLQGTAR